MTELDPIDETLWTHACKTWIVKDLLISDLYQTFHEGTKTLKTNFLVFFLHFQLKAYFIRLII